MRIPRRLSLRALLIVIGLVALAMSLAPNAYRRIKWRDHRSRLLDWSANLERKPNGIEAYAIHRGADQSLSVSTAERVVALDYSSATYTGAIPDQSRFFVVPPGKWVDTIDEVLDTWDAYD